MDLDQEFMDSAPVGKERFWEDQENKSEKTKMEVKVYSKSNCPFCVQAKQFLKKNEIEFTEVNLDDEDARKQFYADCGPAVRSMPQIFVDGDRIGGFQELVKSNILDRKAAGSFGESF